MPDKNNISETVLNLCLSFVSNEGAKNKISSFNQQLRRTKDLVLWQSSIIFWFVNNVYICMSYNLTEPKMW